MEIDRCIYDSDIMANIQYVYQQGHLVASHSWYVFSAEQRKETLTNSPCRSHPDMTTLSWDESQSCII